MPGTSSTEYSSTTITNGTTNNTTTMTTPCETAMPTRNATTATAKPFTGIIKFGICNSTNTSLYKISVAIALNKFPSKTIQCISGNSTWGQWDAWSQTCADFCTWQHWEPRVQSRYPSIPEVRISEFRKRECLGNCERFAGALLDNKFSVELKKCKVTRCKTGIIMPWLY